MQFHSSCLASNFSATLFLAARRFFVNNVCNNARDLPVNTSAKVNMLLPVSRLETMALADKPPSGKRNVLGTSTLQTSTENTPKYANKAEARCVKKVKTLMSSGVHSLD